MSFEDDIIKHIDKKKCDKSQWQQFKEKEVTT